MWLLFAIINPFSESFRNVFSKKASSQVDPAYTSWFNNLVPFIVFTPLIFFIELHFTTEFVIALLASAAINIVSTILYHKALHIGDISSVIPMLSFTPLFLLVISPIITGEVPSRQGSIGILFIVVGSYLLNIDFKSRDFFKPFKSLIKNKGTRYMLFISFIWGISANFDKVAIRSASIWQYLICVNFCIFLGTTIYLIWQKKFKPFNVKPGLKNLIILSCFSTLSYAVHMTALSMTLVAYVIALKRGSSMISVYFGYLFFGEKNLRERLFGSALMFAGVIIIALS